MTATIRGRRVALGHGTSVLLVAVALQLVSKPGRTSLVLSVSTDPDGPRYGSASTHGVLRSDEVY